MLNRKDILLAVADAADEVSALPPEVLAIPGFCPPTIRHFLNNICCFKDCNYLEIGCFQGASLISAAHNNKGRYTGIDNFSEFDNIRANLDQNINQFTDRINVNFLEGDCWTMNPANLPKNVNVYLYDGNHSLESQKLGITHFDQILSDKFILMVDDYSWADPYNGTKIALEELNYKIELKLEIHDDNNEHGWWNGFLIMLANKQK